MSTNDGENSIEKSTMELSSLCRELNDILTKLKEEQLILKTNKEETKNTEEENLSDSSESQNLELNDDSEESNSEESNSEEYNLNSNMVTWNSFQKLLNSQLKLTSIFMELIRK